MPGRQARAITPSMLRRMLIYAKRSSDPERNRVVILLSAKAGLRACEIAGLDWSMVLDAKGKVGHVLSVNDRIAKKRSGRQIPLHPDLRCALARLRRLSDGHGAIVRSVRGAGMRPNSIVNWFVTLFQSLGFQGCSSHSGRRTFVTNAARQLSGTGASLRDVQILAGHRSIETTQAYIDSDSSAQRKLIARI